MLVVCASAVYHRLSTVKAAGRLPQVSKFGGPKIVLRASDQQLASLRLSSEVEFLVNSMADQNNNEDAVINCNLPKDAVERILVGLPVRSLLQFKSISVDGFVYWLGTRGVEYIICFDLIKDKFKLMDVPDDRGFDRELVRRKLMVLRGSLAMIVSVEDGTRDTEIWMLVKGNSRLQPYLWTKKFILEPFSKETTTLGMWNDHKLLVVVSQTYPHALRQVYSYDLVTKETEYFHMPKEQDLASFAAVRFCEWFCVLAGYTQGGIYYIYFDLIKDEFNFMDVPDDCGFDRQLVCRMLMVLRGSLAMLVSIEDSTKDAEIWMLVNEKSSYSSTKKFNLSPKKQCRWEC
ncbi:hypothetical protein MTR67_028309 [Solanum verrucosum]|uniref:F-box associated beta-propeller type 3 domain-containing protein n=1 Tax=Solanum verrucosum TaxID=315347 RepID=A0AAF0RB55_SOLVR|nr:hypothetical protein MTR67_028309 [Solanum verrucosum]